MVFACICACVYPFLLYFSQNLVLSGNFFALASYSVFSGLIFFSGGLHSPFLLWYVTIPPVCIYYMKKPYSLFWPSLVFVGIFGMGIIEIFEYQVINQLDPKYHAYFVWFNFGLVALVLGSVAHTFLRVYAKVNQRLKASNESLQSSNQESYPLTFSVADTKQESKLLSVSFVTTPCTLVAAAGHPTMSVPTDCPSLLPLTNVPSVNPRNKPSSGIDHHHHHS